MRAVLPPALAPLGDLVANLRWSWHPPASALLEEVDRGLWARCGGDPQRLLGEVSADRLAELAADEGFVGRLREQAADLETYLTAPRWYQSQGEDVPGVDRLLQPRVRRPRGAAPVLPVAWGSWPVTT